MSKQSITIMGAGLCGSLLAVMLSKRNYQVTVYERQADPRIGTPAAGRSINLAMAARGIGALKHGGIFAAVEPLLLPMKGRRLHAHDGSTELQSYGQRAHEVIYSVSRALLNRVLIDTAEEHGVNIRFGHRLGSYDRQQHTATLINDATGESLVVADAPIIAADGGGSVIRQAWGSEAPVGASEDMLAHGYKELTVPPGADGDFQMDPEALHIWPRGGFMLIALPNPGKDFTLTLFLANEGEPGFDKLDTVDAVNAFFNREFADVVPLIPDLAESFLSNPLGHLGTIRCNNWTDGSNMLLIGDAAHAIVPFHGQGMNAAFEDCRVFDELLDEVGDDWPTLFAEFQRRRIDNANAIADMALENYVEMRDSVNDPAFKLQKELAFELERRLPERFIPRYSMVMFHDEIDYADAQRRGRIQQALLQDLTAGHETLASIDLDAAEAKVSAALEQFAG